MAGAQGDKVASLTHQLLSLLNRRQRVQCVLLLGGMMVRAVAQLAGVAAIVPFISIVADPDIIRRNDQLRWLYERGGFESDTSFLTAVGLGVIAALAVSNGVSALTTWASRRFVASANHYLSMRLLRGYLHQPYAFFVNRNSAGLSKNILSEVTTAVNGVLLPSLNVIAQSMVVVAMAALLIAFDPLIVLGVVVVLGGAYSVVYFAIRRRQEALGEVQKECNRLRFKVAGEAFGGIKDVKVLQRESEFLAQYGPPSRKYNNAYASNAIVQQLPRYMLETLAFSTIVIVALYYLRGGAGITEVLPALSLFAVASYRMMPAIQTLFGDIVAIRFNRPGLDDVCRDLDRFTPVTAGLPAAVATLNLSREIRVDNVTFRYPGAASPALDAVSFEIPPNQTIGLVGASGSGKTTMVDLLLGLYEPEQGRITIDDTDLNASTVTAWRRHVGYVPQHIFLTDDSIARNIAFGVSSRDLDVARVEMAARVANIHEFVTALPEGYGTLVGERGVRLSGGQRQRIGIARALYHDPSVLVLDEATSALDGATEDAVMEAIRELAGRKTMIIIAHRLTTVQDCDHILVMSEGKVIARGTFDTLLSSCAAFRALAQVEPNADEVVVAAAAAPR
jgi:ATP-binding cassette, subfamily B, bacterial PglK